MPRKATIIVRRFGSRKALVEVETRVFYRGGSRGKVVINGNNTTLGLVNACTHRSLRGLFNMGICLGL